jgi:hypothetical protein
MSYIIDWLIPQRVVMVRLENGISVQEWGEVQEATMRYIETGQPPVHTIFDASAVKTGVANINQIKSVSGLKPIQHPNIGWYIILQGSVVIRFFASLAIQTISPDVQFTTVGTVQDALDVLRRNDTSLSEAEFAEAAHRLT